MPDNSAYLAFLRDPDQASRVAELRDFFGPNADVFLKVYERLREDAVASPTGRPKFRLFGGGFEAAAFFLGPVWFFYRKMWAMAWTIVGLLVLLAFLPIVSRAGVIVSVLLATLAHRTYVQWAIGKLTKMRLPDGALDPAAVRVAGGVSKPAGYISGAIFGLLCVAGIFSIIYLAMHGVPPQ